LHAIFGFSILLTVFLWKEPARPCGCKPKNENVSKKLFFQLARVFPKLLVIAKAKRKRPLRLFGFALVHGN